MNRVLVVSSNIGSSSTNMMVKQEGVIADFICYNDTNFPSRKSSFTPAMTSRIPKMLAWEMNPGYDYYIWMDRTFNMTRPDSVLWFLQEINGHDALFFKHPFRNSILKEAEYIVKQKLKGSTLFIRKTEGEPLMDQVNSYLSDHTFSDNKLLIGGIFCYSSELVKDSDYNMLKEWFHHVCKWSVRDQLSLPYMLSKFKVNYKTATNNYLNFEYAKYNR